MNPADVSLIALFGQASWIVKAVMLGLLSWSVWVWAIAIDKVFLYSRTRKSMDRFEQAFWSGESIEELYRALSAKPTQSMAACFVAAMREWKRSFAWDALALCLWPLVWMGDKYFDHLVLPFLIIVLYLAAFRGRICSAVFSNPVLTTIGGMCYSIYLFHFPIIYAVKHNTAYWHIGNNFWVFFALQSALILPPVLLFCGAFFVFVERPCMDREWPKKLWQRWQTASWRTLRASPSQAA